VATEAGEGVSKNRNPYCLYSITCSWSGNLSDLYQGEIMYFKRNKRGCPRGERDSIKVLSSGPYFSNGKMDLGVNL